MLLKEREMTKKPWTTPELIVLVRSKPEEAVLASCKNVGTGGALGPSNNKCDNQGQGCETSSAS